MKIATLHLCEGAVTSNLSDLTLPEPERFIVNHSSTPWD